MDLVMLTAAGFLAGVVVTRAFLAVYGAAPLPAPKKFSLRRAAMPDAVTVVVFNGNSVRGILHDVQNRVEILGLTGDYDVVVVTLDDDRLPPPPGVMSVSVSAFRPEAGRSYVVISNGGRSAQALPVTLALQEARQLASVWDVQPDATVRLWPPATPRPTAA